MQRAVLASSEQAVFNLLLALLLRGMSAVTSVALRFPSCSSVPRWLCTAFLTEAVDHVLFQSWDPHAAVLVALGSFCYSRLEFLCQTPVWPLLCCSAALGAAWRPSPCPVNGPPSLLTTSMMHPFSLACWLSGSEVLSVVAVSPGGT